MVADPFDPKEWTKKLIDCIKMELLTWRGRMKFDVIRTLAIDCAPWGEPSLIISFLTDRESFDEEDTRNWSPADWRMFHFTSGPNTHWPYAEPLMREAHDYYASAEEDEEAFARGEAIERRDELCYCCAEALMSETIQEMLKKNYKLAEDFDVYAGHPDEPDRNFCEEVM